jgi:hypothetical protein
MIFQNKIPIIGIGIDGAMINIGNNIDTSRKAAHDIHGNHSIRGAQEIEIIAIGYSCSSPNQLWKDIYRRCRHWHIDGLDRQRESIEQEKLFFPICVHDIECWTTTL